MKKKGVAYLGGKKITFNKGSLHRQLRVPENKTRFGCWMSAPCSVALP